MSDTRLWMLTDHDGLWLQRLRPDDPDGPYCLWSEPAQERVETGLDVDDARDFMRCRCHLPLAQAFDNLYRAEEWAESPCP